MLKKYFNLCFSILITFYVLIEVFYPLKAGSPKVEENNFDLEKIISLKCALGKEQSYLLAVLLRIIRFFTTIS